MNEDILSLYRPAPLVIILAAEAMTSLASRSICPLLSITRILDILPSVSPLDEHSFRSLRCSCSCSIKSLIYSKSFLKLSATFFMYRFLPLIASKLLHNLLIFFLERKKRSALLKSSIVIILGKPSSEPHSDAAVAQSIISLSSIYLCFVLWILTVCQIATNAAIASAIPAIGPAYCNQQGASTRALYHIGCNKKVLSIQKLNPQSERDWSKKEPFYEAPLSRTAYRVTV